LIFQQIAAEEMTPHLGAISVCEHEPARGLDLHHLLRDLRHAGGLLFDGAHFAGADEGVAPEGDDERSGPAHGDRVDEREDMR
jgi:hypothetical protein